MQVGMQSSKEKRQRWGEKILEGKMARTFPKVIENINPGLQPQRGTPGRTAPHNYSAPNCETQQ
jgi:hypothetical protein